MLLPDHFTEVSWAQLVGDGSRSWRLSVRRGGRIMNLQVG